MFASNYDLKNITAIIDRNSYQIDGPTEKVMKLEPLDKKWESFGWKVLEINGHDMKQIVSAFENSRGNRNVIIANTIKGKGVSFLENNNTYHSKPCSSSDCELAIRELNQKLKQI